MSSQPIRHNHTLGSNPWIFLDPSCANALLILFVGFVLIIDLIIISIHWNISSCSDILKLWIIGKYFAPLLSYLSCCLFVPCNYDETYEVTTSIPYSQHELRQRRMRQNVFNFNPISQIRNVSNTQNNNNTINNPDNNQSPRHSIHEISSRINISNNNNCIEIPYPYDIMLSEWFVSPSTITTNIAESMDDKYCKLYIYIIGMVFDRGILELIWLFVGGLSIITEDKTCRTHTPFLYFYVMLQIILGAFITSMLLCWMVSSSVCPLQVARLMACCYGMECDILGLLPRHLFQRLLTMHNTWNQRYNGYNNYNGNNELENINTNQYQNAIQIAKNYHTLSTIPHHYEQNELNESVELTTANTNTLAMNTINSNHNGNMGGLIRNNNDNERQRCGMCDHIMEYEDDTNVMECSHEFHSVCIDAWPINLQCPRCLEILKKRKNNGSDINNNNDNDNDIVDDSDNELDSMECDTTITTQRQLGSNIQLL